MKRDRRKFHGRMLNTNHTEIEIELQGSLVEQWVVAVARWSINCFKSLTPGMA